MVNILRTLISKAQKRLITESLDTVDMETEMVPIKILNALEDSTNIEEEIEIQSILSDSNLTEKEKNFISLRLEGLTMEEISVETNDSAYKIRQSLQNKLRNSLYEKTKS